MSRAGQFWRVSTLIVGTICILLGAILATGPLRGRDSSVVGWVSMMVGLTAVLRNLRSASEVSPSKPE